MRAAEQNVRLEAGDRSSSRNSDLRLDLSGAPRLLRSEGSEITGLRKKDLALITYLWLNGRRRHQRSALASLLWANREELKARHSLTQALRRIQAVVNDRLLILQNQIEWRSPAPAATELSELVGQSAEDIRANRSQKIFLDGFFAGVGGDLFDAWVDQQRDNLKVVIGKTCQRLAEEEERSGRWEQVIDLATFATHVDLFDEEAHRRILRAWVALGQKSRALKHYYDLVEMLKRELDALPDPETRKLYENFSRL